MIWIIGDLHGYVHTLSSLVDKVRRADVNSKFVFVGDYVDRGPYTKEILDMVLDLKNNHGAICLRGNHDDIVSWLVNDTCVGNIKEYVYGTVSVEKVVQWWIQHGFIDTLKSYQVKFGDFQDFSNFHSIARDAIEQLKTNMPDSHKEFLQDLPLTWESDTHFACHGFFRYGEELPRSLKFINSDRYDEILWSRFPNMPDKTLCRITTKWDKIGVFGHTPTLLYKSPVPIKMDKIRLIDTGVSMKNYLTAYSCELDDWILQDIDPQDLNYGLADFTGQTT